MSQCIIKEGNRSGSVPFHGYSTRVATIVFFGMDDWLLIYRIDDDVLALTLAWTGTHSDLFDQ